MRIWAQPKRKLDGLPLETEHHSRTHGIDVDEIRPIDVGYLVKDALQRGSRLYKPVEMDIVVHVDK